MSRKATYTAKAAPHVATKLSAFDLGHTHSHMERRDKNGNHTHAPYPNNTVQVGTKDGANTDGSDQSATSPGDVDAEDESEDSADADEEGGDTEDPDEIAPSGGATEDDGHQAGPPMSTTIANTYANSSKDNHHESSDDEVYNGIDLISDSEKDGSDMDHLEERAIVDSEDDDEPRRTSHGAANNEPPVAETRLHDSDAAWEGLDFSQGTFGETSDFFDEQFGQTNLFGFLNDDCDDFSGFPSDFANPKDDLSRSPSLPSQRRVRFAEPLHSEIEGLKTYFDDDGKDMFQKVKQEPIFSSGSLLDGHSDADSDSSSGYESDYGETTDEDDIPASATARPQALMRRSSVINTKSSSSATPSPVRQAGQRWGPKLASWCIDPTKPLAIVDSCGKRLLVCPARRPTKPDRVFEHLTGSGSTTANTSPRAPPSKLTIVPNESDVDHSDLSSQGMVSPMFGPPNALDNVLSENNLLTTNAAYPDYGGADISLYSNMEYDDYDDDDDDYENAIKMEDLFNLTSEEDDSDAELGGSRPSSSSSATDALAATGQRSLNLLDHLDSGVVTAFRQNQNRVEREQQDILQPRSPLRKRKASPPVHAATRRRIMA